MMRVAGMMVLFAAMAGCGGESTEPTLSEDLATAALDLTGGVEGNGSLAIADAMLLTGSLTGVTMSGADRLLFASPDEEVPFVSVGGSKSVAALTTSATALSIIFEREGGERLRSPFDLPSPFVLVSPPAPATLTAPLTFTWDIGVGTYETDIDISSACFNPIHRGLTMDTGAYTLQPADIALYPSAITSCDIRVTVTRSALTGMIAVGFAEPRPQRAKQIRQIRFPASIQ